jgi:hypothetical protein
LQILNFSAEKTRANTTYFAFITQVHVSSGILTPPASYASQQSARKVAGVHRTLSFWCCHETSFSKRQRKPIFPGVVHHNAFDGRDIRQARRSNPTIPPGSKLVTEGNHPKDIIAAGHPIRIVRMGGTRHAMRNLPRLGKNERAPVSPRRRCDVDQNF